MAPPDSPTPRIDPIELRTAMARFPTGVTIVTALSGGDRAGLTANAVTSLSLDPPLMLACLDRGSRTLRAVESAGRFGINVLGSAGEPLARRFARKLPMDEKWEGVELAGAKRASRSSKPRSSSSPARCATCSPAAIT